MDELGVLQAWLLLGVPSLVAGVALYVARNPLAGFLAFVALAAGFGAMSVVHRPSAAVFGGLLALLYAAGRGGPNERVDSPDWRRPPA